MLIWDALILLSSLRLESYLLHGNLEIKNMSPIFFQRFTILNVHNLWITYALIVYFIIDLVFIDFVSIVLLFFLHVTDPRSFTPEYT